MALIAGAPGGASWWDKVPPSDTATAQGSRRGFPSAVVRHRPT
jgi:hypothetical protein